MQLNELNELNSGKSKWIKTEKATRPQAVRWLQYDKISALCRFKMIPDIVEIPFILPQVNHTLASHHGSGELLMGFLHSAQSDKLVFGIMFRQGIVECRDAA